MRRRLHNLVTDRGSVPGGCQTRYRRVYDCGTFKNEQSIDGVAASTTHVVFVIFQQIHLPATLVDCEGRGRHAWAWGSSLWSAVSRVDIVLFNEAIDVVSSVLKSSSVFLLHLNVVSGT